MVCVFFVVCLYFFVFIFLLTGGPWPCPACPQYPPHQPLLPPSSVIILQTAPIHYWSSCCTDIDTIPAVMCPYWFVWRWYVRGFTRASADACQALTPQWQLRQWKWENYPSNIHPSHLLPAPLCRNCPKTCSSGGNCHFVMSQRALLQQCISFIRSLTAHDVKAVLLLVFLEHKY